MTPGISPTLFKAAAETLITIAADTVEGCEVCPNAFEIDEAVDRPQ
jgi:hypothetical protein